MNLHFHSEELHSANCHQWSHRRLLKAQSLLSDNMPVSLPTRVHYALYC